MLEDIRKDIEKLIALYERERAEVDRLRLELSQSNATNDSYRKQIADLEREVDNLKLAEAFKTPYGGSPEAKEKVNRLIREIDKCISLLER